MWQILKLPYIPTYKCVRRLICADVMKRSGLLTSDGTFVSNGNEMDEKKKDEYKSKSKSRLKPATLRVVSDPELTQGFQIL